MSSKSLNTLGTSTEYCRSLENSSLGPKQKHDELAWYGLVIHNHPDASSNSDDYLTYRILLGTEAQMHMQF